MGGKGEGTDLFKELVGEAAHEGVTVVRVPVYKVHQRATLRFCRP